MKYAIFFYLLSFNLYAQLYQGARNPEQAAKQFESKNQEVQTILGCYFDTNEEIKNNNDMTRKNQYKLVIETNGAYELTIKVYQGSFEYHGNSGSMKYQHTILNQAMYSDQFIKFENFIKRFSTQGDTSVFITPLPEWSGATKNHRNDSLVSVHIKARVKKRSLLGRQAAIAGIYLTDFPILFSTTWTSYWDLGGLKNPVAAPFLVSHNHTEVIRAAAYSEDISGSISIDGHRYYFNSCLDNLLPHYYK